MSDDPTHSDTGEEGEPGSGVADPNKGGLVSSQAAGQSDSRYQFDLEASLDLAIDEILSGASSDEILPDLPESWRRARELVASLQPVPWFIWRLVNFVLGNPGKINSINDGMVFGMRRLLFAAASDEVLGEGMKINNVRQCLHVLKPDVIAALATMHAVARKLSTLQFDRIWKPLLEDAFLRAQIGYFVGQGNSLFGPGRAMLAGFSGRSGIATLIASGDSDQARRSLEILSRGIPISQVGERVYDNEPLQVSAMTLAACGCGKEAAFGTAAYAAKDQKTYGQLNDYAQTWLAAFTVIEGVRSDDFSEVDDWMWRKLGFPRDEDKEVLIEISKVSIRRGHGWSWLF